jgi:hypothetical protein
MGLLYERCPWLRLRLGVLLKKSHHIYIATMWTWNISYTIFVLEGTNALLLNPSLKSAFYHNVKFMKFCILVKKS